MVIEVEADTQDLTELESVALRLFDKASTADIPPPPAPFGFSLVSESQPTVGEVAVGDGEVEQDGDHC